MAARRLIHRAILAGLPAFRWSAWPISRADINSMPPLVYRITVVQTLRMAQAGEEKQSAASKRRARGRNAGLPRSNVSDD
jgi:hypothetical protein